MRTVGVAADLSLLPADLVQSADYWLTLPRLAVASTAALGLDNEAGLLWTGMPDTSSLPRMLMANPALAIRVRSMLAEAYDAALVLVRRHRVAVEALADVLVIRRTLDGAEAAEIVGRYAPASGPPSDAAADRYMAVAGR